jgi:RNA recognition motif-containing protein
LYIEKLPYAFEEKDLVELFSKYGTVLSVKIKKPNSNVPIQNINHLPCSAYVNFGSED